MVRSTAGRTPKGLSPRERGKRAFRVPMSAISRPIPARAGETSRRSDVGPVTRAYPRASGGNGKDRAAVVIHPGLSPARAGETTPMKMVKIVIRAYPRASGGNFFAFQFSTKMQGPIPARAGETAAL